MLRTSSVTMAATGNGAREVRYMQWHMAHGDVTTTSVVTLPPDAVINVRKDDPSEFNPSASWEADAIACVEDAEAQWQEDRRKSLLRVNRC